MMENEPLFIGQNDVFIGKRFEKTLGHQAPIWPQARLNERLYSYMCSLSAKDEYKLAEIVLKGNDGSGIVYGVDVDTDVLVHEGRLVFRDDRLGCWWIDPELPEALRVQIPDIFKEE